MSKIIVRHTARIYVTPRFLRKLANKCEDVYKNAKWGDSLLISSVSDEEITIEFIVDQEKMGGQK